MWKIDSGRGHVGKIGPQRERRSFQKDIRIFLQDSEKARDVLIAANEPNTHYLDTHQVVENVEHFRDYTNMNPKGKKTRTPSIVQHSSLLSQSGFRFAL